MSQSDSSPTKKQKLDDGLGNGNSQNKIGAVGIRKEKDNEVENAKHKRPHYNPFESGFDALSFSDFSPYNYYYTSPSYDPCHTLSSPFDYFECLCGAPGYLHSPNTNYSPTTPEYYPCHTLSSTDSFPTTQPKLEAGLGNGKSRNETGDEIKEVNFLEILEKKDNEAENDKHAHYDPYGYGGSPFGTGCSLSYYPQYHPYSSHDSDTSPDYGPTSSYCTTFPDDSPTSPHYRLPSPYWPTSPGYYPPSHYRSTSPDHSPTSPYSPTHPQYCPTSPHYRPTSPQHSPTLITPPKGYGFGPVDMEAENKTSDHIKEIGDERCHMGGRNYHEAVATRMIHVPCPKVALLVGAVATLRFLQHDLCGRIRILKDSEVDLKSAQRPVELTGTDLQIEYAQQLIDSVLAAEENHHEPMEEETKKTIFSERERL